MTICIAAIGKCEELENDDEAIVFATDHMISLPMGQFEHSIEKYKKINSNTIAMLSGEALLFEDIIENASELNSFDEIRDKIHQNMIEIKDYRINKWILDKFKINFDYLKQLLMAPEHNDTVIEILDAIKKFNLQSSIILAGFKDNKAHIAEISEVGSTNARDINFDAIGTGATQAINTLLFQRHSKNNNLKTTLYNVYKAKKNSEVAVGVGRETDIFILLKDGKIYKINDIQIQKLNEIYQNEMKFGKEHEELEEIINNLDEFDV